MSDTVIGVGLDLVDVERFRTALARTPSLATRLFAADEQRYANTARDPVLRLAARFAAKEAFLKSIGEGLGACQFRDIAVVRADSGRPGLDLRATARQLAARHGATRFELSLTHTGTAAGAVVIAITADAARPRG